MKSSPSKAGGVKISEAHNSAYSIVYSIRHPAPAGGPDPFAVYQINLGV